MDLAIVVLLYALLTTGAHAEGYNETALRLLYSGVTDWVAFTPPADVRRECADGVPLRIAYFTRHTGTLWDWIAVAAHLDAPWTRVNPGLFMEYGINASSADRVWRQFGQLMCRAGDVLVFSDTIPDARPVLQGGCQTPIVLQVTNRFDYGVLPSDLPAYLAVMGEAARRPNVWWATNNPYEEEYMARRGLTLPLERRMMLRPVGTCLLPDPSTLPPPPPPPTPPQPPPAAAAAWADGSSGRALAATTDAAGGGEAADAGRLVALLLPAYSRHLENTFILPWLMRQGLMEHVQVYRHHYGGPAVLARHRGVITVPYQTSVMKMYEGLAAGAVFVIPSPELFGTMIRKLDMHHMSFCCRELLRDRPNTSDWSRFMDWYHPDFASTHITYNDLKLLGRFVKDVQWSSAVVAEKRAAGQAAMAASRQRSLAGYEALFGAVRRQACAAAAAAAGAGAGDVALSAPVATRQQQPR